jgi:hypothetical protein
LELSEGRAIIRDPEMVDFRGGGFVLVLTGVQNFSALSVDSVVDFFEFHDALNGSFAGNALDSDSFLC